MGNYRGMIAGNVTRILAPAVLAAAGLSGSIVSAAAAPVASAQPCPDVQVLFARGTGEDPGVGPTGQAFVDNLRQRVGGRSFDVYPVNYPATVPKPLAPDIANHVAAVVLFGTPNVRAMNFLNEPPVVIGPTYASKTIKVCAPEDPVCSDGMNFAAHDTYADDGSIVAKGADFAASRINAGPPPGPGGPAPVGPAGPGGPTPVVGSPHGGFGS